MAKQETDWNEAVKPLIKKYKSKKHPLEYHNLYELIVMVVLSAQTNDRLINNVAPKLFETFPDMASLSRSTAEGLYPYVSKVIGFRKKSDWLIRIAQQIKENSNIPKTMNELVKLPGIGRKSANVIMREAGVKAEGVMVDLHVIRVGNRLGIAKGDDPKLLEQQIMEKLEPKNWGEIGMAISHLGREICRPTDPEHDKCVMNKVCEYYLKESKKKKK